MKIAYKIILLIMAIFISGCPMIDWKEFNFTRSKPIVEDIVGIWKPTPTTLSYIRQEGGYPEVNHELNFRADGTFSMLNMPDWWQNSFGRSWKSFHSENGTWKLKKDNMIWDIWVIELKLSSGIDSVNLYGQESPYLIFIRVGDPNDGKAMFFERSELKAKGLKTVL